MLKRVFCEDHLNDVSSSLSALGDEELGKGEDKISSIKHALESVCDTDWAGCEKTRKSTSCCHEYLDGNMVFGYSRNQKGVSLSSTESEYYGASSGCSEGLFLKSIQEFISGEGNVNMVCRLDNSAARQLVLRSGVSKIRHIEARMLWLQEKAKSKAFSVAGISTVWNTADLGTKGLTGERINMLLYMLGTVDAENGFKPVGEKEFERET